jgi:hypothetical protein
MIYFLQNAATHEVKIGWTENWSRRRNGYRPHEELLLTLNGGEEEEKQLLRYWTGNPRGGWFPESEPFYDWLASLAMLDYAVAKPESLAQLPNVPLTVWHPDAIAKRVEADGQISLLRELPPRERIRQIAALGEKYSLSDEWLTPCEYLDAARRAFGGEITTDPASCYQGQANVNAKWWYHKEMDGLDRQHPWRGTVWLNPPYGRGESSAKHFIGRLIEELAAGNVTAAITVLNDGSCTSQWFKPVWATAESHCVHIGRINFLQPPGTETGSSPNKGSIFSYWGPEPGQFASEFAHWGPIVKTESR